MAEHTEISWAHSTFNPWVGCTKVSPGCDNCYAKTLMDDRYHRVKWGAGQARSRTKTWDEPKKWDRLAALTGQPWRVFCASLADVFDNEVPSEWRLELGHLIWLTPNLTWMLLTKRIGNVAAALRDFNWTHFPSNVWLGITVVNQEEADRDIPKLLKTRANVRWLSCEPLLGPVDLGGEYLAVDGRYPFPGLPAEHRTKFIDLLDWVIVGGESGPGARPMDARWARDLRDQCAAAGVPFHFKQWGEFNPEGRRTGKKASGHLLDGVAIRNFPTGQSSEGSAPDAP